jgi:hypothetical protein
VKPPAAVKRYCEEFGETEEGLLSSIKIWRETYESVPEKATDWIGWLAFKLSANRNDAYSVSKWYEARKG